MAPGEKARRPTVSDWHMRFIEIIVFVGGIRLALLFSLNGDGYERYAKERYWNRVD